MKYITAIFSVLILIFIASFNLYSEETLPLEQEEAPATLWDMNLGDTDVDLYLAGYWKMGLIGGLSIESSSDGITFPADFPGLTQFSFYQEPDLTISLWLMNRFYLEASFLEGFDKNTYAMGYRGMEGEPIQTVRIGNSEIAIDEYTGINVPSADYNTPGISASFQTDFSTHDVMLRYDPTSEESKVFLGEYEVTEETLDLSSYTRGRYFILPDENIDSITIYIADEDGIYTGSDNLTYRKATNNEASYSLTDGTVTLTDASKTDVLVYYKKGTPAVGDITLGRDFIVPLTNGEPDPGMSATHFDWTIPDTWDSLGQTYAISRQVTVNGVAALKVYNPLKFGPFEYFNTYKVGSNLSTDSWKNSVKLVDKSFVESSDSDDFLYHIDTDDSTITVFSNEDTAARFAWTRYPLADDYSIIYGSASTDDDLTGRYILLSTKSTGSGYNLGSGVIQGSVEVYINGNKSSSASVDYDTGKLTFSQYIFSSDRIKVTYRTETVDLSGGDLLFAQGNRFYPADNLQFYVAEMFRWNSSDSSSSSLDETSQGGITVAGGMEYTAKNFNLELNSTVSLQTDDTSGILRVQGMEDSGYSFSISESLLKQTPESVYGGSGTRADLTYTDYFSTNGYGEYYLNSYNWTGATADAKKSGPSVAAGVSGDDFDSNVMVMEYDLGSTEWSAGDLLLSTDGPIDLSRFTSVSMKLKTLNSSDVIGNIDDINISIIIGETGERKDWNDDGFTSDEDTSLLFSEVITNSAITIASDGIWYPFKHEFTDSEKELLTKSRAIRVIVDTDATAATGRLLMADVQFEGSLFDSKIMNSFPDPDKEMTDAYTDYDKEIFTVTEVEESSLEAAFDEISDIFHSSGETQKALKVEWDLSDNTNSALDGDYWILETYTEAVPINSYETFSFYIKSDISESYTIELKNSDEKGYSFPYSTSDIGWVKLNLNLASGAVSDSNGSFVAQATVDPIDSSLTLFRVTSTGPDTSGTMYLDELHYSDPTFTLEGTVELITDYKYPGDIITSSGGFPILSNFSFYNQLLYSGGKVLTSSSDGSHAIENDSSFSLELLMLEIKGNVKVDWSDSKTELSGSHALTFPADFPYGHIYDSYSRSGDNNSSVMTRENKLLVNMPDKGSVTLSVSADGDDSDLLLQSWGGKTQWKSPSLFKFSGSLLFEQQSEWNYRDQDNYLMNWIDDFRLIVPENSDVDIREVSGDMNVSLEFDYIEFSLNPYLSFETETGSPAKQTNKGGFDFSVPLKFTNRSGEHWSITPSYSRSFVQTSEKSNGDSFGDGFNNLSHDLGVWLPLTSFIPIYELFALSPVSDFKNLTVKFNDASYTPAMGIALSRKFGSELYDLFLPYYFNIDYSRNFNKSDDTLSNSNNMDITIRQTAINMFGEFGTYSRLNFYNTDEFTSSLSLSFAAEGENIPLLEELVYQSYLSFYGNNNKAFTFENRFENDFEDDLISDSLDIKFIWRQPMKENFNITYLNNLIEGEHYWSHEETLGFDLSAPYKDKDDNNSSVTVTVKHQSTVTAPDFGALKTWLTLGFYGKDDVFKAGFEAGLELEISF